MELTGGVANRMMGGDEKSECTREEVGSGYSVRVERWVRPLMSDMVLGVKDRSRLYVE